MAKIPTRLEELLPLGAYEKVVDLLHRPDLSGRLREALGKVGIREVNPLSQVQDAWQQAKTWLGSLSDNSQQIVPHWINATGQLIPPELDRVPMIPSVSLSWARIHSAYQVRSEHLCRAQEVVQRSFGTNAFPLFLHDPLSAVQVVTRSLGRQIYIARCDSVRVPGWGDVRAILAAMGNNVIEVGATNGTTENDWCSALVNDGSAVVFLASPSTVSRDSRQTHRTAAIAAAKKHGAKVVELMIDGCLNQSLCHTLGFPNPQEQLKSGSDIVLLPTHFLLGGPRGVLCLGDASLTSRIQIAAENVGCEMDSAGIAASLLTIQLSSLEDEVDRGMVGFLAANPENLKNRCNRLAIQIQGIGPVISAKIAESQHSLGSSPWDNYRLSNAIIEIECNAELQKFVERLKTPSVDRPAILTKIYDQRATIDLRFVHPDDDHHIASAVRELAKS